MLGYGTDRFPGFYLHDSGFPVPWRVDSPGEVAAVLRRAAELGTEARAIVVAEPVAARTSSSTGRCTTACWQAGLAAAAEAGVRGKDVTPFLLDYFHRETDGASLEANVAARAAQRPAGRADRRGGRVIARSSSAT